jgi:hypothetical protein
MEKVTIYSDIKLGSYSPEDGDLSEGFITDCDYVGMLTDEEGKPNTLVYEGENYVCLLTLDSGYGRSSISLHDKSVFNEIKDRIK